MSEQTTDWLFSVDVQAFLKANEDKDPMSFLLSKALVNKGWDTKVISRQLKGLKISKTKFPTWHKTQGIVFPVSVSLEQASSELAAQYKASLIFGDKVVDLSGGMGIDSYFISRACKQLVYVEPNQELHDLTQQNFKALKADSIQTVCATAEEFLLQNKQLFSVVYVDPSRRKEGQRLSEVSAWEPDVMGLKPSLWEITSHVLIKMSPMVDITHVCKEIGEVKEVHVVSDRNECKEVLLLLEKGWEAPYAIHAIALKQDKIEKYTFSVAEEQAALPNYSSAMEFLYEPDVALLKAGAFKKVALDFNINKIHPHTHLYTSKLFLPNFLGRCFQVETLMECSKKNITKLVGKERDFHVIARNAALTADQVKAQWKLIERGDVYLILYKGLDGVQYIVKTKRIEL